MQALPLSAADAPDKLSPHRSLEKRASSGETDSKNLIDPYYSPLDMLSSAFVLFTSEKKCSKVSKERKKSQMLLKEMNLDISAVNALLQYAVKSPNYFTAKRRRKIKERTNFQHLQCFR